MILPLDYGSLAPAVEMARRLRGVVGLFKIGFQLFTSGGPAAVEKISRYGKIFLDLKFHDIPNTLAGAVRSACELPGIEIMHVHALGGLEMMRAAREALPKSGTRPKLIAVTVLTSHDARSLARVGVSGTPADRVIKLAALARQAGLDGVVCSAQECARLRRKFGEQFLLVPGGIRPAGAAVNDQKRVATPGEAIRNGASYLLVGRPITAAKNPRKAAEEIVREMQDALAEKI